VSTHKPGNNPRIDTARPIMRRPSLLARARTDSLSRGARRCRRKFLRLFPDGFQDEDYRDLERDYKWEAHARWEQILPRPEFRRLIREKQFDEVASRAIRIEQSARHSMIFSFEKMALRDAVRSRNGAQAFAKGLYDLLHGRSSIERRFERWIETIDDLPRKQTRVLTWPIVTVFGFIAQPATHVFLKPNVMRAAALEYGFDLRYSSRPSWKTYASLLEFAATVHRDLRDLRPRDMIDIQSFLWIQGSDEYGE
jgi:hypothetical protein